jgi:hypothetical protein
MYTFRKIILEHAANCWAAQEGEIHSCNSMTYPCLNERMNFHMKYLFFGSHLRKYCGVFYASAFYHHLMAFLAHNSTEGLGAQRVNLFLTI